MVRYIKCPRCELNYIDAERQEYCDVCLKELKGVVTDMDENEDVEEDLPTEICPVCGENMMHPGDKMCEECRKKAEFEDEETDPEEDDEWREYLDDDTDAELDEEISEIAEQFDDEFEDEVEEEEEFVDEDDEDDLDYVTGDEIYALSDEDDEDDEQDGDDDF